MCLVLEFIPEGDAFPLVLLSDSTPEKAEKLSQALTPLVTDNNAVVDIHTLPFVSPVDGCRLSAQVSDEDIGAILIENTKNHFTWELTHQGWELVLMLLGPFTEPDSLGYQYLGPDDETDYETSDIEVILSGYYRNW